MSGESFDDLDRDLAERLGALAPGIDAVDTELEHLRPRFRRARRRNRAVRAGSVAALALVVLGAGAALAARPDARSHVNVAAPSTTVARRPAHRVTTTTVRPRPTVPTTLPARPSVTTLPAGGGAAPLGPGPTAPLAVPPATSVGSGDSGSGSSGPPPTNPSPTTTPGPVERVYTSDGGSVTVRLAAGVLHLVAYQANSGFTPEVTQSQADDVEVRFHGQETDARIRVRVVNGALVPEITNHGG